MHILDLIMYFVGVYIIWLILYAISDGDYTEEIGGALIGIPILFVYTVLYIILFAFAPDWNWSEILKDFTITINW